MSSLLAIRIHIKKNNRLARNATVTFSLNNLRANRLSVAPFSMSSLAFIGESVKGVSHEGTCHLLTPSP